MKSPSKSVVWTAGRAKVCLLLAVVATLSSGLYMLNLPELRGFKWKQFWFRGDIANNLHNLSTLSTKANQDNSSLSTAKEENQLSSGDDRLTESSFSDSEMFKKFVKTRPGNYSSVEDYLTSTVTYLLSFRSPVIREQPDQYSWPETVQEQKHRQSNPQTKRVVMFNRHEYPLPNNGSFSHCPVKDCVMSAVYQRHRGKPDALVFHAGRVHGPVFPRAHADQVYIFKTLESPMHTPSGYRGTAWNSAMNWTWSFYPESDIFSAVRYLKRSPSPPLHSALLTLKRQKKKSVAWMVSHCVTPSQRYQYVRRLRKILPVDIYGSCGTLSCTRWAPECDLLLNDYLFYLSFENSMCVDYITEKFYKTFTKGVYVLPVVRGGANYSRYFPEGTFIDAEAFSSPEELGNYLLELAGDEARYVDMLWRRAHFVFHGHGGVDAMCQLCYKLHHLHRFRRTYSDLYGWFHHTRGCYDPKPV